MNTFGEDVSGHLCYPFTRYNPSVSSQIFLLRPTEYNLLKTLRKNEIIFRHVAKIKQIKNGLRCTSVPSLSTI